MRRFVLLLVLLVLLFICHAWADTGTNPADTDQGSRDVVEITVGSGDQQALIPVNMYYRNSLFETIYMANEMNVAGQITHIRFYNNFMTNLPDKPTQIWLGQTDLFDLTGGWIPSSQLTEVFWGDVDYPAGQNEITIPLTNPFTYHGGNLVMMVFRPWENDYYTSMELFYAQTVGTNRSLTTFNNNTEINPDNPPTTGVTGQFPKTTFTVDVSGMGSLSGNVSSSGVPLEGATVSIEDTYYCATTGADGNYSFPYVPAGNYDVSAVKTGYAAVSHNVSISADQNTTQDFELPQLVQVTVSGRIVGSDAPGIGIDGAGISFTGYADYTASTDTQGNFSIAEVYANQTYSYIASASGYQVLDSEVTIGNTDLDMGDIVLNEIAYPPQNAVATESWDGTFVDLEWEEPNVAQEGWLHYDSGENNTSFGTAGSLSFDVAIRYPPDALTDYAGGSLQAVRIWPAQGGNFSVRVWTGGDASAP
ncbi:MAG: carboxypeptidase regulatory-like domain-containing protein, partial [Candidatus Syntrophosphaera sp.]